MIWIAALISTLVAGVLLSHFLLSPQPPKRRTRPTPRLAKDYAGTPSCPHQSRGVVPGIRRGGRVVS